MKNVLTFVFVLFIFSSQTLLSQDRYATVKISGNPGSYVSYRLKGDIRTIIIDVPINSTGTLDIGKIPCGVYHFYVRTDSLDNNPVSILVNITKPQEIVDLKKINKGGGDEVFLIVDKMPEFPGGELEFRRFIANAIKYPVEAQMNGIMGKVFVSCVVDKDGSLSDIQVVKSVNPLLDNEAVRVVRTSPKWKPGLSNGKPVRVSFTFPVSFVLVFDEPVGSIKNIHKNKLDSVEVFSIVEQMPEFPGGEKALRKFIADNLRYPRVAIDSGIMGKVYVTFTVEKDGSVSNPIVIRGVDPDLDREAIRLIRSLPKWTPGKQNGKPVRVSYTVPVSFLLH